MIPMECGNSRQKTMVSKGVFSMNGGWEYWIWRSSFMGGDGWRSINAMMNDLEHLKKKQVGCTSRFFAQVIAILIGENDDRHWSTKKDPRRNQLCGRSWIDPGIILGQSMSILGQLDMTTSTRSPSEAFHSHGGTPMSVDGFCERENPIVRNGWWLGVALWKPPLFPPLDGWNRVNHGIKPSFTIMVSYGFPWFSMVSTPIQHILMVNSERPVLGFVKPPRIHTGGSINGGTPFHHPFSWENPFETIQLLGYSIHFLVGGLNPSEKYDFVNWDDEIPNIWENKKCSKPPTSFLPPSVLGTSLHVSAAPDSSHLQSCS